MSTPIDTAKRCTGCKHYVWQKSSDCQLVSVVFPHGCANDNNRSVVDGSLLKSPEALRYGGGCGESGKWFEPVVPLIERKADD